MPTFRNPLSPPKEHGAGGKELKVRKKSTSLKRDKNYPPLYQRGVRGVVFFGLTKLLLGGEKVKKKLKNRRVG